MGALSSEPALCGTVRTRLAESNAPLVQYCALHSTPSCCTTACAATRCELNLACRLASEGAARIELTRTRALQLSTQVIHVAHLRCRATTRAASQRRSQRHGATRKHGCAVSSLLTQPGSAPGCFMTSLACEEAMRVRIASQTSASLPRRPLRADHLSAAGAEPLTHLAARPQRVKVTVSAWRAGRWCAHW